MMAAIPARLILCIHFIVRLQHLRYIHGLVANTLMAAWIWTACLSWFADYFLPARSRQLLPLTVFIVGLAFIDDSC
jgi:hypothetical protein